MRVSVNIVFFFLLATKLPAQLKFIVDDFEGMSAGHDELIANGIFTFGSCKVSVQQQAPPPGTHYIQERYVSVKRAGKESFAGWGKGVGLLMQLDQQLDHLNFYFRRNSDMPAKMKLVLQDDDNASKMFEDDKDDSWSYTWEVDGEPGNWKLQSFPLNGFRDENTGGDGVFNITYKEGRLLSLLIVFEENVSHSGGTFDFDFLSFSQGRLNEPQVSEDKEVCSIGVWSKEKDITQIAPVFEGLFHDPPKRVGVVHFFQPFAFDGGTVQNNYPSVQRVNKIIEEGCIPMITLENHFVNGENKMKQPNLYSIVEGHMDDFFSKWALQIKQVKGIVLLRILHEFNGDWYPWCVSKNDNNPALLINAFRRIYTIFKKENVQNVKFIWCPNSMSVPQESWNYIMDAYPGDEYVDCIGMDIYNGAAQKMPLWRSFRKEGIENYFLLTRAFPGKPLFVCETASREREKSEPGASQTKPEWIREMSIALQTDMNQVTLLSWFNEKGTFKVNSSERSRDVVLKYLFESPYFVSGPGKLLKSLQK